MWSTVMDILSILIFLLLSFVAVRSLRSRIIHFKKKRPPLVTTVFHHVLNFHRMYDFSTDLCRKHKTYRVFDPNNIFVVTANPANVEYILKTNFSNYGKGMLNYIVIKDLLGDGIFAVDGEKWRHQRKLASYEFSAKNLRDFSSDVFKKNAAKLAHVISSAADSQEPTDIQDLFMKSTMDSIFKVGFGLELNSLEGSEEGSEFAKAFDDSNEAISRRFFDLFWIYKKYLCIGSERELKRNIKIVDDFIYKLIDMKMKLSLNRKNDSVKKEDLLSRFLSEVENDPENMTRKYLRDIILNFLIAGKDTTAITLSWFIFMLCKNPNVQEKVAREVKIAMNSVTDTNFETYIAQLTDEALDKMQYLHATLTETMRLYPAVPQDPKECFGDDTLPDGFNLSKGTVVVYHAYAMGRMKYIWGEDAEAFRPERWIDADGFFQPESPFKFTAFQAGPRICLGKEFAYRQMKIFAAVLLPHFKFKLRNENEAVNYRTMLTLHIDHGLHVHVSNRSNI